MLRYAAGLSLALAAVLTFALPVCAQTDGATVFAYFKEPANDGIYFALSRDGRTFTPLNDGKLWVRVEQPGELMRDVFVTRNPDGHGFRMVWTWAWHGDSIGVASSPDLLAWTPHREIHMMQGLPDVQNTWAPETCWDATRKQWLIVWSSSFNSSQGKGQGEGLRLWASRTQDWQTFSRPEKFFDRGFPVIDATIVPRAYQGKHDFVMVFKDQTVDPLRYDERWVSGPTVEGPWGDASGPINESWSEGPSVTQLGNKWLVFYDHYRPPRPRFEAVETSDWVHWTDATDSIHLPEASKHGSFFHVSAEEAAALLRRHDGVTP